MKLRFYTLVYLIMNFQYDNSTFFNERIMMAIIQEDENSNTSRRRVVESSEYSRRYPQQKNI
jgi:hypothetical protein